MPVLQQRRPFQGYDGGGEMPLDGYATLLVLYNAFLFATHALVRQGRGRTPEQYTPTDWALLALATHKVSRILTRDWVTAPLRAPFTKYQESAGAGEVREESRGQGLRRATGDLLTCNWCIGPWVATALVGGMATAPRATRTFAAIFAFVAVSDFLHEAYGLMKDQRERLAA